MRVADRSTARNYLKYLNKAKNDFAQTNERIASGKRFTMLSDDVGAGTRVLRARTDLTKTETHLENVQSVNEELSATESAMTAINDVLGMVYGQKAEAAMSEEKGEAGRLAIANEIKAMKEEILQFANTRYSTRYVFGGSNASQIAPFRLDEAGKLLYNGIKADDIRQRADGSYCYDAAGVETDLAMDEAVFLDIGLGIRMNGTETDPNTAFRVSYSGLEILGFGKNAEGMSNNIFNVLTDMESSIRNFNLPELKKCHAQLGQLNDKFRANLTDIGAKTNFLDTMETRLKGSVDSYKAKISGLMGVNDAEESTNQAMNEYVLKAVIQMGARILPVSLMDFLR
ncbi:MAG: hypothetical protein EOM69_06840 [Clostridia bacterium]|nr:hypothetical protein [Clostridia bacterium]